MANTMKHNATMRRSTSFIRRRKAGVSLGIVLLLLAFVPQGVGAQALTVTHIRPESDTDTRNQYFIRLLDLALSKTEGAYTLVVSPTKMQQGRALVQLEKGIGIDVVWTMTSASREQVLRPIRIPLLKGLIGTRLLLINKEDQAKFERIKTSAQLQALNAGQGHDWPDTEILKHNGYAVVESASYDALFRMLQKHRIDYFPRSVEEIWAEAEQHAGKGLVVEESIAIQYTACIFFFVNKNNHVLARRLKEGLQRTLADRSFDKLYSERFNEIIERAHLNDRIRFDLENPLLPPEGPVDHQ